MHTYIYGTNFIAKFLWEGGFLKDGPRNPPHPPPPWAPKGVRVHWSLICLKCLPSWNLSKSYLCWFMSYRPICIIVPALGWFHICSFFYDRYEMNEALKKKKKKKKTCNSRIVLAWNFPPKCNKIVLVVWYLVVCVLWGKNEMNNNFAIQYCIIGVYLFQNSVFSFVWLFLYPVLMPVEDGGIHFLNVIGKGQLK